MKRIENNIVETSQTDRQTRQTKNKKQAITCLGKKSTFKFFEINFNFGKGKKTWKRRLQEIKKNCKKQK